MKLCSHYTLAILSNAAINTKALAPFRCISFPSDMYEVVGLLGHWKFCFSFLRNSHTVFHNIANNSDLHQMCTRVPFSSHPFLYLPSFCLINSVIHVANNYVKLTWAKLNCYIKGVQQHSGLKKKYLLLLHLDSSQQW